MGDPSPFILPDGPVAVAFSGGRTSAYMLHQILEANSGLPARAVVSFQNTGREMPETLDFVHECGERWGVRIVWLEYRAADPGYAVVSHNSASRDGEPFMELIRKRKLLPNQQARFCTIELKVRTQQKYLRAHGWENWIVATGIRADEMRRAKPHLEREKGTRYFNWQPLVRAGVSKQDVTAFWARQSFDLRLTNVNGKTPLGNCDGCFLKSEANLAALARDYPERAAWWARAEAEAARLGRAVGAGTRFHVSRSMADVIEMVERQGDWIFEAEDALCQADGGECV